MNKQELIERIEGLPYNEGLIIDTIKISRKGLLELVSRLDEPEKPVLPQFVADWIEKVDGRLFGLNYDSVPSKIYDWVYEGENLKKLHLACAIGYTVEKEAKYAVKVKGKLGQYLGRYYLNNEELTPQFIRTQQNDPSYFTKAELVNTGFGWVFDCPGVEVQEVE